MSKQTKTPNSYVNYIILTGWHMHMNMQKYGAALILVFGTDVFSQYHSKVSSLYRINI